MSNVLAIALDGSEDFNSAAFIGHGLRWPGNKLRGNLDLNQDFVNDNHNRTKVCWNETSGQDFDKHYYYANKYNDLLRYADTVWGPVIPSHTDLTKDELIKMSRHADKA